MTVGYRLYRVIQGTGLYCAQAILNKEYGIDGVLGLLLVLVIDMLDETQ